MTLPVNHWTSKQWQMGFDRLNSDIAPQRLIEARTPAGPTVTAQLLNCDFPLVHSLS